MTPPSQNSTEHNEKTPGKMEPAAGKPGADKPQNRRRRLLLRLLVAALAGIALIFGIPIYLHSLSHESTDDAFIDGHIIAISPRVAGHVARVYVTDNQWVKAGDRLIDLDPADFQVRLEAAEAALAAAQAAQRSGSVGVDLTTITAAADLDGSRANVAAAKAAVEAAKAQAAVAASQRDQAKAQIAISAAALDQAKAEADSDMAKHRRDAADLKRYREMSIARTISGRDLDHAVAAEGVSAADLAAAEKKVETYRSMLRQAQAALKAAEDNLHRADAQVTVYRAQLDQAVARLAAAQSAPKRVEQSRSQAEVSSADVDKARAEAAQARLNLSYTRIHAPADGFVTKKAVEPGAFVQEGQSLLAIVPRKVWVTANFKETQLTRMRPGQPVEIKVDAYPDITFQGHVDSIQRGTGARFSLLPPENATGNYVKVVQRVPVKITFDASAETGKVVLAPGMSVVPDVDVAADGHGMKQQKGAGAAP
jgi:membrane fusion protein (multidrug efflux system)